MDTDSDTPTDEGHWLGPNQQQQKLQHGVLTAPKSCDFWKLTSFFKTSVPEIDKIMEERITTNQSSLKCKGRRWWQQDVPDSASLGCQRPPTNDVISSLPDEILSSIVSMMSLRDAATTSVLSKRWCKLWRCTGNLQFDVKTLFGHDMTIIDIHQLEEREILLRQHMFLEWVNQILEAHYGSEIKSLGIQYPIRVDKGKHVLRWIKFAAEKKAEKLYVHLGERPSFGFFYGPGFIVFPHELFDQVRTRSNLRHLSLSRCLLKLPVKFDGFASLVTLEIQNTPIQQEDVDGILTCCSKLEWLTLGCFCPKLLKFMSHENSPLPLKHLNVDCCCGLEEIEIESTIKLVSLEYSGPLVSLRTAVSPVRLFYRGTTEPFSRAITYVLEKLPQEVVNLKTLLFTCFTDEPESLPRQLGVFSKLKHLILSVDGSGMGLLELTCSFLKAAPLLFKFELTVYVDSDARVITKQEQEAFWEKCSKHQHLKIVHLLNSDGQQIQLLLAQLLMKYADLKHMRIIRNERLYSGDGEWSVPNLRHAIPLVRRRKLRQLLHGLCPADTKLKIV